MHRRAALGFALAGTALYVGALLWADQRKDVFATLPRVAALLPLLMAFSLASYTVRYLRWRWLLQRAGHATPWLRGWLAYLSGFAFTASPGKLGELVRIRYLMPLGVRPETVLAAFVYERALDLLALLLLASLAIQDPGLFVLLVVLVAGMCLMVAWLALRPAWLRAIVARLHRAGFARFARLGRTLQRGLAGCLRWSSPRDLAISLALGLAAWTLTSAAFVWLLSRLDVQLPLLAAVAVYPTAMLAGAASLVPGGIGATEAMTVVLLLAREVPMGAAVVAAVAIRLSGLWFAVGCGLLAAAILERRR